MKQITTKEIVKNTIEPVNTLRYPVRSYTDNEIEEFLREEESETKELRKLKLEGFNFSFGHVFPGIITKLF